MAPAPLGLSISQSWRWLHRCPGYVCWVMLAALEGLPLIPRAEMGWKRVSGFSMATFIGAQCNLSPSESESLNHTQQTSALLKPSASHGPTETPQKGLQSSSDLHTACTRGSSRAASIPPGNTNWWEMLWELLGAPSGDEIHRGH